MTNCTREIICNVKSSHIVYVFWICLNFSFVFRCMQFYRLPDHMLQCNAVFLVRVSLLCSNSLMLLKQHQSWLAILEKLIHTQLLNLEYVQYCSHSGMCEISSKSNIYIFYARMFIIWFHFYEMLQCFGMEIDWFNTLTEGSKRNWAQNNDLLLCLLLRVRPNSAVINVFMFLKDEILDFN